MVALPERHGFGQHRSHGACIEDQGIPAPMERDGVRGAQGAAVTRERLGGTSDPRARPTQEKSGAVVTSGDYRTGEKAAGIIGLTKTAALEYAAHNLRVNVLCPGLIDTPMADRFVTGMQTAGIDAEQILMSLVPIKRRGTPEEIAEAAVWLCSEAASYVTGHSMIVDGGFMAI
jgi:hypothetical protein